MLFSLSDAQRLRCVRNIGHDERVIYSETPRFAESNAPELAGLAAGTTAFVLLLATGQYSAWWQLAWWPALLALCGVALARHRRRFVCLTSKKVIFSPGSGAVVVVPYADIQDAAVIEGEYARFAFSDVILTLKGDGGVRRLSRLRDAQGLEQRIRALLGKPPGASATATV